VTVSHDDPDDLYPAFFIGLDVVVSDRLPIPVAHKGRLVTPEHAVRKIEAALAGVKDRDLLADRSLVRGAVASATKTC
jgi:hypothetical protein